MEEYKRNRRKRRRRRRKRRAPSKSSDNGSSMDCLRRNHQSSGFGNPENQEELSGDTHLVKFGRYFSRSGKIFSYTFWRTQINDEVFWSIQGNDSSQIGAVWIVTRHFGASENSERFIQEVMLRHPTEKKISITYSSVCEGTDQIEISKYILNQFKDDDNTFNFQFRVVKTKAKYIHKGMI